MLLLNPGLELGDLYITRAGNAFIGTSPDPVYMGVNSGKIVSRNGFPMEEPWGTGQIEWDAVTVTPGEDYSFAYWFHANEATSNQTKFVADVSFFPPPTSWKVIDEIPIDYRNDLGWHLRGPFTIKPTGPIIRLRLRSTSGNPEGVYNDRYYVDDLALLRVGDVMAVSKWTAIQALKTQLATIRGEASGYRTQLGGRVFDRLIVPEDGADIPRPYLCMPLLTEDQAYDHEERAIRTVWTHRLHFFVDESHPDKTKTSAAEELANGHDDIVKALMEDFTLGGAIFDMEIIATNTFCATLEDDRYGELVMDVRLIQRFDRDDLGVTT